MRILLIHNLAPWDPRAGGGQRVQHELAAHAAAAGHDVRVLYLGASSDARAAPYPIVWVAESTRGRARLAANALAVARTVRRLARGWRPDVVHASAAEAGLLPFVLPPEVGLVATSHHPDPPPVPASLPLAPGSLATVRRLQPALLEAHLLRRAHRVVAVSRWGARALVERGYLPAVRPVAVVPNGVGDEWFAPSGRAAPAEPPAFLAVGRVEPAKGWDVLLAALGHAEAPPLARCAWAGAGPDQTALSARAAELGLSDRVLAHGWVAPDEVRAGLAGATALVLPSRRENYPLVLLEAMAAGVPVVATRVGGIPEMIEDGRSGLLVAPDDPAALARALARVAQDRELRRRLIEGGRAVAEHHRWARIVERLAHECVLARELARPVPRAAVSPLSALYRGAAARTTAAGAPHAQPTPPPAAPARIAVIRPGRLGDLLLADPLVAALRERWPDAALELVTDASDRVPPWMLGPQVAQRTLALRRGPDAWRRASDGERRASLDALADRWRAAPPDVLLFAYDLADPVLRALAGELARAAPRAWRAGLAAAQGDGATLHASVAPGAPDEHESARLLRLGAAAGAEGRFRLPRLPRARSPLGSWDGPTVVVHPGASRSTKRWPLGRWGRLAALLAERGARTVVVGDAADRAHVPALGIAFDDRALVDAVGALDLTGLAAAIAGADAFAGNDSFPFHLAAAAGIPALVLVGPGALRWSAYPAAHVAVVREPVLCSPRWGEECPVYTTCPHAACMQSIRVETVGELLLGALDTRASAPTPAARG